MQPAFLPHRRSMKLEILINITDSKAQDAEIHSVLASLPASVTPACGNLIGMNGGVVGSYRLSDESTDDLDEKYRDAATEIHARDTEIQIDPGAAVSIGNDGAYVSGWLFVPAFAVEEVPDECHTSL
jgi:hypothetical protein